VRVWVCKQCPRGSDDSPINGEAVDLERWPQFKEARWRHAMLEAGDCLYHRRDIMITLSTLDSLRILCCAIDTDTYVTGQVYSSVSSALREKLGAEYCSVVAVPTGACCFKRLLLASSTWRCIFT
jgi:hypothetical protein